MMWDQSTERRFFQSVDKNGPLPANRPDLGPCWIWTGLTKWKDGEYGRFSIHDKKFRAYRLSYENLRGPIPHNLQLDHLCLCKQCVNPAHLELVTSRENTLRASSMVAKNAQKTHCVNGHPFDSENTRTYTPTGRLPRRECKICRHHSDIRRNRRRRGQYD